MTSSLLILHGYIHFPSLNISSTCGALCEGSPGAGGVSLRPGALLADGRGLVSVCAAAGEAAIPHPHHSAESHFQAVG